MDKFLFSILLVLTIPFCSGCSSLKPDSGVNASVLGVYRNSDDGSTLKITRAEEGKYAVSINLFRLTEIDNCIGQLKDGKLIFTGTDASENPISGEITVKGDSAKLAFLGSTWEYLPDGTTYIFNRE